MKAFSLIFSSFILASQLQAGAITIPLQRVDRHPQRKNLTETIAVLDVNQVKANVKAKSFDKVPDVAQYGGADWKNVVGITRNVSLEDAQKIASNDRKITFFFYMKSGAVTLTANDGNVRQFRKGDAVFFTGTPQWGAVNGLSDGYIKQTPK